MNENMQRERLVVVDTSALMDIPDVMNRIYGKFYVPLTVIKQLDGLKNSKDEERSKMARRASYFIENGPQVNAVTILTEYDRVDGLNNESDNKIVGAAVRLMKNNPDAEVILLTTDRNMRIVASGYGIDGMDLCGIPLGEIKPMKFNVLPKRPRFWVYIIIAVGAIAFALGDGYGSNELMDIGILVFLLGIIIGMSYRITGRLPYNKSGDEGTAPYNFVGNPDRFMWQ